MRRRKLETIAKRWWRATDEVSDDAKRIADLERVDDLVDSHPDLASALIRALVATAPARGPHYVGTSVVEGLHYTAEFKGTPNPALQIVLAANLSPENLVAVLSGVYPDLLEEWDARTVLANALSEDELDWLLDPTAPDRRDYL